MPKVHSYLQGTRIIDDSRGWSQKRKEFLQNGATVSRQKRVSVINKDGTRGETATRNVNLTRYTVVKPTVVWLKTGRDTNQWTRYLKETGALKEAAKTYRNTAAYNGDDFLQIYRKKRAAGQIKESGGHRSKKEQWMSKGAARVSKNIY